MAETKKREPRQQSITMRLNKDGTMTIRAYGGLDLRKILNLDKQEQQK